MLWIAAMKRHSRYLLVGASATMGLCIGIGAYHLGDREWVTMPPDRRSSNALATDSEGSSATPRLERRPDFALPDLYGTLQSISQWDGRVLVINFWASWCAPCLHEIPIFIALQTKYADRGVQFLGIAIDHPDNARRTYEELGMNYPSLHGQGDAMTLGERFGNQIGGLPFTVVVDREGNIVASKTGPFEREEAEQALLPFL